MKFKTTIRLFVIVCLLAASIWVIEHKSDKPSKKAERAFTGIAIKDVDYLLIERGSNQVECIKKDSLWYINAPIRALADAAGMDRILSEIDTLLTEEVITAGQRKERELSLDDYGLKKPVGRVMVGTKLKKLDLHIGLDAPVGSSFYAKFAGSDDVVAIPKSFQAIFPVTVEDLRDRSIVNGDLSKVTMFEVSRPDGFIRMKKKNGEWFIEQPIEARANSKYIDDVLGTLFKLKILNFVQDTSIKKTIDVPESLRLDSSIDNLDEKCGFAPDISRVRMALGFAEDEAGVEIILGKDVPGKKDEIYAKRRVAESVFTVTKEILPVLSFRVSDVRDHRIFSQKPDSIAMLGFEASDKKIKMVVTENGWMIEEPIRAKADDEIIRNVLSSLCMLNVDTFVPESEKLSGLESGLETPALIISVSTNIVDGSGPTTNAPAEKVERRTNEVVRLLIGSVVKDEKVYIRHENNGYTGRISAKSIQFLSDEPADQMTYADRVMMALSVKSINKITLKKAGTEQVVSVDTNGIWNAVLPASGAVNVKTVDNILFAAANLRAHRIESYDASNLAGYGLGATNGCSITLWLGGDKGIKKTILLGYKAKSDGIYAAVQGQDVIFVLRNETAAGLARDIVIDIKNPPQPKLDAGK